MGWRSDGAQIIFRASRGLILNTYNYEFKSKCPNDGETISYLLTIKSKQTIFAEDIVDACGRQKSAFHEVIADELAYLGGFQTIHAEHCGVKIKTERGSP